MSEIIPNELTAKLRLCITVCKFCYSCQNELGKEHFWPEATWQVNPVLSEEYKVRICFKDASFNVGSNDVSIDVKVDPDEFSLQEKIN